MKKLILIFVLGMTAACGSSNNEVTEDQEVSPETTEKIKEAQDVNTELEEIDGELDSLLNLLN